MQNLFKRITSNAPKGGAYLRYALGEIFLVMVGILLAVQVNNLNEHRKDRNEEQLILKGLLKEFLANKTELESTMSINETIVEGLQVMYRQTGNKWDGSLTRQMSDSLSLNMTSYVVPAIGTAYLDDILTTGKILIIQDKKLQYELTKWPKELDDHAIETEDGAAHFIRTQSAPFMDKNYHMNIGRVSQVFHEPSGFEFDHKTIYQIPEFENLVLSRASFALFANEENQILLDLTHTIIALIQNKLNN